MSKDIRCECVCVYIILKERIHIKLITVVTYQEDGGIEEVYYCCTPDLFLIFL